MIVITMDDFFDPASIQVYRTSEDPITRHKDRSIDIDKMDRIGERSWESGLAHVNAIRRKLDITLTYSNPT